MVVLLANTETSEQASARLALRSVLITRWLQTMNVLLMLIHGVCASVAARVLQTYRMPLVPSPSAHCRPCLLTAPIARLQVHPACASTSNHLACCSRRLQVRAALAPLRKVKLLDRVADNAEVGLMMRFQACASAASPWVIVHDDDVQLTDSGFQGLLEAKRLQPDRLYGYYGRSWDTATPTCTAARLVCCCFVSDSRVFIGHCLLVKQWLRLLRVNCTACVASFISSSHIHAGIVKIASSIHSQSFQHSLQCLIG